MSLVVVDVEADGPVPGLYSMVSFGAVIVDHNLNKTFYGETSPISQKWIPEALAISNITREQHERFQNPGTTMKNFVDWLEQNSSGKLTFVSDNVAFDWQFINYYMHFYIGRNPFGFSGRRIGDFYAGLNKDFFSANKWKRLRKTTHTHNPVDDAKGNAEALLEMSRIFKIKLPI